MAFLIFPGKWLKQPQGLSRFDRNHPLARDVRFEYNAATGKAAISTGSKFVTPFGLAVANNTDHAFQFPRDIQLQNADIVTVQALLYGNPAMASGTWTRIFGTRGATNGGGNRRGFEISAGGGTFFGTQCQIFASNGDYGTSALAEDGAANGGTDLAGKLIFLTAQVVRVPSTSTTLTIWMRNSDGKSLTASGSTAAFADDEVASNCPEICGTVSVGTSSTNLRVLQVLARPRRISTAERRGWETDPWAVYRPIKRRLYVASGATSGAITGSIPLTLTPTGTLTGSGALASSVAVTIAPSGALTGRGALAATVPLTLTPSGALTGTGALAATVSLSFTPTGTLTGSGALVGAAPLTFGIAGVLTGTGALASTVPLALGTSGTLTSASSGAITGAVPVALTVSGTLTGSGALASTVPISLTVSSTLTGAGALTSTTSLALSIAGALTSASPGAISGTVPLALNVTSSLTGTGRMAGATALALGVSGSLTGTGALAGSSALTFGVSGTLANGASSELASSVGLSIGLSGTLTGTGALLGAVPLTFSVIGRFGSMGDGAHPSRTITVETQSRVIATSRAGRVIRA